MNRYKVTLEIRNGTTQSLYLGSGEWINKDGPMSLEDSDEIIRELTKLLAQKLNEKNKTIGHNCP